MSCARCPKCNGDIDMIAHHEIFCLEGQKEYDRVKKLEQQLEASRTCHKEASETGVVFYEKWKASQARAEKAEQELKSMFSSRELESIIEMCSDSIKNAETEYRKTATILAFVEHCKGIQTKARETLKRIEGE